MIARSSGCGLCPWSCSGKVGAYASARYGSVRRGTVANNATQARV